MVSISSNGGGATASFSLGENQTVATTVTATGGGAITYSISGGLDALLFTIDAQTGVLSFVSAPNFESAGDSGADNVYDVEVTASDGTLSASQALAITIDNVDEAPVFTSATAFVALENGYSAALLAASDPEGGTITYSITGGEDYFKLNVTPSTGQLSFITAPNFEAPADHGQDGTYKIDVRASDGTLFVTQTFSITIGNVNEGAMISSNGAGATAAFSVPENQLVATTVTARDNPVGTTIAYAIAGGSDSSRFTINAQTGVLSFVSVPNFESPNDSNFNNVYEVIVSATDGTVTDTQALSITIANVNEPFTITPATYSVAEGSLPGFLIQTNDPDSGALTFTIVGGADAARFKTTASGSNYGSFSFLNVPNFEAPTDSNGDNVYEVTIQVSDGVNSETKTMYVTVTDVQENVVITSNGGANSAFLTRAENQTAVMTFTAVDPDNGTISWSLSGGADASKFAIDAATGALAFLTSPDYELPTDSGANRTYDVIVRASDGVTSATQAVAVTISNVIEPFAITSNGGGATASVSASEGYTAGFTVTTGEAGNLTYSLSGADAARFTIVAGTGGNRTINFAAAPNFEAPTDANGDNVYEVTVTVSGGGYSDSQAVAVTVGNVNEAPVIGSNGGGATAAISRAENGTSVTTVTATDPENMALTYSIWGGADAAKFTIDSATGALAFLSAPDFEAPTDSGANGVYDVVVQVSDGSLIDTQAIAVTVTDVDEGGPVITSNGGGTAASISVAENSSSVTTVAATATPPFNGPISYAIAGGADSAKFTIDPATGALAFVSAPNFEVKSDVGANGVYDVIVRATDGVNSDIQAIAVTVTNVNEAPVFTYGGSMTVTENSLTIGSIVTTDPENNPRSYSIVGGTDSAKFTINSVNGTLSFVAAPNFELPTDADSNNVYEVVVRASDGTLASTQNVSVTVSNVNEAPVITSNGAGTNASLSISENSTAVTIVAAADPENTAIAYSISGGADSSKFTINATTGALSFVTAPNFEVKTDVGANGVYDVIVRASDGINVDTQAIAVTVTNVNEAPVITSNGGGAAASVSLSENSATVTIVTSTDPEGTARTYSIAGGADAARFTMSSGGVLSFVAAPDFDSPADSGGNNVYDVIVQASDGVLTDTQAIAVTITNVNEAPVITSNGAGASAAITVGENGTAVTVVASSDPENTTRTYSISGGADSAKFAINPTTGALSFLAAPNFESPTDSGGNNVYDVIVKASDGVLFDTQALAVTVANVNEAPAITSDGGGASAPLQIDENGTAVTTVQATDPDGGAPAFAIAGGADAALFLIDPATGALAFLAAPDYEAPADADLDNVYEVTVSAGDGSLFDLQDLSVTVADLFDSQGAFEPVIGPFAVLEMPIAVEYF
ncbi:MAG TPA: cadherin domain-containing protein [Allosphingosinicella sp.]|nr:cadherin domain-containing protein [Allosphingosinicella sp.]